MLDSSKDATSSASAEAVDKAQVTPELVSPLPVISEQEKELAVTAYQEFEKNNYEAALAALDKLLATRPHDPKVLLNKAVVEYHHSGFTKTDEFKKALAEVCAKAHVNIDNVETLEDVDHCVIFLNQAVLLYHLHQHHAAISILDKVFQFIEPLEDRLARRIFFLLLELYLCTQQPEKALGLISYMESIVSSGKSPNGNKPPSPEKDKESSSKAEKADSLSSKAEKDEHGEVGEMFNEVMKPKIQQYKARCYLMLRSTKACKREIKNVMNSGASIPVVMLRSHLEYLRGNYRKALKMLNSAMSSGSSWSFKSTGDHLPSIYYNNVGCIHFHLGKPNLGAFYFGKALQEYENALKNVTNENESMLCVRPLHLLSGSMRYQLLHNLGIQYLHAGRPLQAFDCLVEAVQVYHTNPRLWLRLAECCIRCHKPDNSRDFKLKERKKELVKQTLGSGPHRKLILTSYLSNDNKTSVQGQSAAIPVPTLEFASICLCNALYLLPDDTVNTSVSSTTSQSSGSDDSDAPTVSIESTSSLPVPPSSTLQGSEIVGLRNSILAASAYVSLCLGDVVMALKHAEALLAQPRLSGAHRLLGHLYAAEALIIMDHIGDAIPHLNPDIIKDISLTVPQSADAAGETKNSSSEKNEEATESKFEGWYPNSISTARVIMQYNLAIAYTLRGEYDKAIDTIHQIATISGTGADLPAQVIMLTIYIRLQQGHADIARSLIKQQLNSA